MSDVLTSRTETDEGRSVEEEQNKEGNGGITVRTEIHVVQGHV
jgi:hypothetical protein